MKPPALVLVAHGTRDPTGVRVLERIAWGVSTCVDAEVRLGYVDVIGPSVTDALAASDGPAVVVPAFLARGYHVRVDLPAELSELGRTDVVVTEPLGPAPELAAVMRRRLSARGWQPGDEVVFAAAGSSDERALAERAVDHVGYPTR